jgi:hypothetical protein
MPRVRLFAFDAGSDTFPLPNQQVLTVRAPRLFARVRLGAPSGAQPDPNSHQIAILDTGMPLSVFPVTKWEKLESTIEFIPTRSEVENNTLPVTNRLLGCTYTYRLGRIPLAVLDREDDTSLAERAVLARFLVAVVDQPQGASALKHVVLGMSEGVLEGRALTFRHDRDETRRAAWLEE